MKLTYRGINHEHQPSRLEPTPSEICGKYRGQNWSYNYPRHVPNLESRGDFKYRGISYKSNSYLQTQPTPVSQAKQIIGVCSVPIRQTYSSLEAKTGEIHWENIRRNLEHRLQVAKANGNHTLVSLLEEESKQLSLN